LRGSVKSPHHYMKKAWTPLFFSKRCTQEETVSKRWKEGYSLQSLEYGNNQWFALFCKYDTLRKETYVVSDKYIRFQKLIQDYWQKGYHIIDLAEGRK